MSYASRLQQTATRFYNPTKDGFGGEGSYSKETALVRWQNDVTRFEDVDGAEWMSAAVVYSTAEWEVHDWLYLGTTVSTDPEDLEDAYEIKRKYITQNPNGSIIVYKYILG